MGNGSSVNQAIDSLPTWVKVSASFGVPTLALAYFMAKDIGYFTDQRARSHSNIEATLTENQQILLNNQQMLSTQLKEQTKVSRALCVNLAANKGQADKCLQ